MNNKISYVVITIVGMIGILFLNTIHVAAHYVTIDTNLSVTPNVISLETVFPEEVLFRPLYIALSQSFLKDPAKDDVEYKIVQRVKPRERLDRDGVGDDAQAYCTSHTPKDAGDPNDPYYTMCYPSLCPYLSKEPDNQPKNDVGVPAFHDPSASSSIAYGRLAKSAYDTKDEWQIDVHVPCFRGQCAQDNVVPPDYQLDPRMHGQKFGCDLSIEIEKISYKKVTRKGDYCKSHTEFTSRIFRDNFNNTLAVGYGTHTRTVTNTSGNGKSVLFGAYFANDAKKSNGTTRTTIDQARVRLLKELITAKLNCGAFGCTDDMRSLISAADKGYGTGGTNDVNNFIKKLKGFNEDNESNGNPIPERFGKEGGDTSKDSQARANVAFWDNL